MPTAYTPCTAPGCNRSAIISGRNSKDAAYRAKKAGERGDALCEECAVKAREALVISLAAQAKAEGLPALEGTPKQIAWAEQIRAQRLRMFPPVVAIAHHLLAGRTEQATAAYREHVAASGNSSAAYHALTSAQELSRMATEVAVDTARDADAVLDALVEAAHRQDSAEYWIDTREMTPSRFLRDLADVI